MNFNNNQGTARLFVLALLIGFAPGGWAIVDTGASGSAGELKAKYLSLGNALRDNPFHRPLILDSVESSNKATGEVYAIVKHPFNTVRNALKTPSNWCDIMILHQNTKYCRAVDESAGPELKMMIGKKVSQELDEAHQVDLRFSLGQSNANFLAIQLNADAGPMGTKDYKVSLEAIPIGANQTFMHFRYSYAYGLAGGVAMKAYLASAGRNKVGFTPSEDESGYIGGVRGMVERNTMRYYLAIDSYLGALSLPADKQQSKRLQDWFAATERYPRQLREISKNAYLTMKREEIRRMALM